MLAAGGAHAADAGPVALDGCHGGPQPEPSTQRLQAPRERLDDAVQAAAHVPRAVGVLDPAREGERGGRPPGIGARVRREALDDHPQSGVTRVGTGERREGVPRPHAGEVERGGRGGAGRWTPGRPRGRAGEHRRRGAPHGCARPQERRPVVTRARRPPLERLQCAREVRAELHARPVREAIARHRLDAGELELVLQRRAGRREQLAQHPWHGQQRGSRVEREPLAPQASQLPAGCGALLEHAHVVARAGESHGDRQAAEAGSADRDPHRRSRARSAGTANAPMAAPPARATRGRRHSTTLATSSPAHVHA